MNTNSSRNRRYRFVNMALAALFALTMAETYASPLTCPPGIPVVEAAPVNPACPGLGAPVLVSSTVYVNDNWGGGDSDFNDVVFHVLRAADGLTAAVTWLAANSSFNNVIFRGSPLFSNSFHPAPVTINTTPGAEIEFAVLTGDFHVYYSGDASRNADNTVHFLVAEDTPQVPEVGALSMVGSGLVGVGLMWKRRRRAV